VSPLGVVPKPHTSKYRLTVNLGLLTAT